MSGQRDALLDDWTDLHRRVGLLEANIVLAVDLLMESIDHISENKQPVLNAAIRAFLMNVQVGGR